MNEFFAIQRLSAFIDGDLNPDEMAEVDRAIRENPKVRAEYESLLAGVELLRKAGPARAPAGFHARVMAEVEEQAGPQPFWSRAMAWLRSIPLESLAVAAVAVLVVMVVGQRDDVVSAPEAPPAPVAELQTPKDAEPQQAAAGADPEGVKAPGQAEVERRVRLAEEEAAPKMAPKPKTVEPTEDAVVTVDPGPPLDPIAGPELAERDPSAERGAAISWRLQVRSADEIRTLVQNPYGVTFVEADTGKSLDPDKLAGRGSVRVLASVPGDRLSPFQASLKRLGDATLLSTDQEKLYASTNVVVYIDIRVSNP